MICNDTTQQGLILDPDSYHIFCSLGISDLYLTAGPYVSHGTLTLLHTDGGGEGGRGSLFSTTKPIPKPGATSIVLVLWGPFTLSLHCLLQLYVHQPVKSETSLNLSPLKLTCQEVLWTFFFGIKIFLQQICSILQFWFITFISNMAKNWNHPIARLDKIRFVFWFQIPVKLLWAFLKVFNWPDFSCGGEIVGPYMYGCDVHQYHHEGLPRHWESILPTHKIVLEKTH